MKVTLQQMDDILKTLPVSLYLKRNVEVSLSENDQTSYYVPLEDRIVISYQNVAGVMEKLQDEKELESTVRALLYHEISHAALTPNELYGKSTNRVYRDAINIFCDERIENIFKDYYLGVNFKRNILMLTGWNRTPATNFMEDFFNTVRFRFGKEKYVSRVGQLIKKFDYLTQDSSCCEPSYHYGSYVSAYRQDIIQLFLDISREWMEENEMEKLIEEQYNYESLSDNDKETVVKRILEGLGDKLDEIEKDILITSGMEAGDIIVDATPGKGRDGEPTPVTNKLSDEEIKDIIDEINKKIEESEHEKTPQELLDSSLNKFIDKNLIDSIKEIFNNFLSRTKNNAGAIQRYSGVLNPRALTREDWRIFEYKSENGPIKGYDKLHVNMFIDTSGSYSSNQDKTNTILKAMEVLEETYPFFSFDLVTCQVGEQLRPKGKRYIKAYGGNHLDKKIFEIFKRLQTPNALNYNVVLFDGDAFTDCNYNSRDSERKNFAAFNTTKCSIISDSDNKTAIEKYAPLANHMFVEHGCKKSYSDLLFDNLLNALQRALL